MVTLALPNSLFGMQVMSIGLLAACKVFGLALVSPGSFESDRRHQEDQLGQQHTASRLSGMRFTSYSPMARPCVRFRSIWVWSFQRGAKWVRAVSKQAKLPAQDAELLRENKRMCRGNRTAVLG